VKDFAVYTLMRIGVFVATFIVIAAVWALASQNGFPWFPVLVISAVVSMIISVPLLNKQRVAFAARVEARATAAVERARSSEDEREDSAGSDKA
jgi:hypothetical protein